MVTPTIRTIFAQPDAHAARAQLRAVADMLADRFPQVADALLRPTCWRSPRFPSRTGRVWSTNPLERVNKELKRRANVVGIFPNDDAVIRLLGAVLIEVHDEWQVADRRYFNEESTKPLTTTTQEVTPALPAA